MIIRRTIEQHSTSGKGQGISSQGESGPDTPCPNASSPGVTAPGDRPLCAPHAEHADQGGSAPSTPVWVHLTAPTPEECRSIHEQYGISSDFLKAALDINERPRLEYEGATLLIILRAPMENSHAPGNPFATCPVAFIIRGNLLVSVCLKKKVGEFLLSHKVPEYGERPAVTLMLSLFLHICMSFIKHLQMLDAVVNGIEQTLQQSMQNRELLKMLHMEKSLIYFLTALKGNQAVLEKLQGGMARNADAHEKDLLNDVLIENRQASDMAGIYTQIIGSLGDSFGAIVSNNLNKVMKILTGLTIVFMVPTIISSLYGMNVPLPGQDNPYAYILLGVLSLVITFAVYRVLKNRDWM